jgi:C1A family cysteine protease
LTIKMDREKHNQLAAKLLQLDLRARDAYNSEHPGVLPELQIQVPKDPPKAFDWCALDKVCGLKAQKTSDCWDVGATKALECSERIINNIDVKLSPQCALDAAFDIVHAVPRAAAPFAFKHFMEYGASTLDDYPYTGKGDAFKSAVPALYRVIAWGFVGPPYHNPPVDALKRALLDHGPLEVGIEVSKTFSNHKGAEVIEKLPEDEQKGAHSVLLVGWDDSKGARGAWKVMNHHGAEWGEAGFGWLGYGYNNFAHYAIWVRAASSYYEVPKEIYALVPNARAFPPPKQK